MKKLLISLLCTVTLNTYASEQCSDNFTTEGSFFTGKTFKTWADVEGVSFDQAYKNVYLHITKDGWKITSSDKEIGIISASQDVSFGDGKTAPLNVAIEEMNNKIKLSISYSLSGGVSSPKKAVIDSFCKTIASARP